MTNKQRLFLESLEAYTKSHGYPPTYRELGVMMGGIGAGAIRTHVLLLIKQGLLVDTTDREARSLEIANPQWREHGASKQ